MVATDGIAEFLRVNLTLFTDLNHARAGHNDIMSDTFLASLRMEFLFWALAALGIVLRWRGRKSHSLGINLFALGILATSGLTVALNPAYYSYNLVTLQALLAPFAAYGLLRTIDRVRYWIRLPWLAALVTVALILLPSAWSWQAVVEVTRDSNSHQKKLNQFILKYTRPDQRVFAMEGVGLFRPSLYHWRIPAVLLGRYMNGEWSYTKELKDQSPEIIIRSYRIPNWLTRSDVNFLGTHYVLLTPQILVPGAYCGGQTGAIKVDLLVSGTYEILVKGPEPCRLDGIPVQSGERRDLGRGNHQVETGSNTDCLIRRYYPAEARELIRNPEGLPYFTPPGMELPQREVDPRFIVN